MTTQAIAAPTEPSGDTWTAADECHKAILRKLEEMQQLSVLVSNFGMTEVSRTLARNIHLFFTEVATAHHQDEEQRIFPALLAKDDAPMTAAVMRLQADHLRLEQLWLDLVPRLNALARGYRFRHMDDFFRHIENFARVYRAHIVFEESLMASDPSAC